MRGAVDNNPFIHLQETLDHIVAGQGEPLQGAELQAWLDRVRAETHKVLREKQQLQDDFDELQRKFAERTAELIKSNQSLLVETEERRRVNEALRSGEQFLGQLLDTSPNLIFVKDWPGNFLLVNQAVADIFGITKEELINQNNAAVHDQKAEVDQYSRIDRQVIESGQATAVEEPFTKPDGTVLWYYTIKTPFKAPDGSVNVLAVSLDITERKQSEDEKSHLFETISKQREQLHLQAKRLRHLTQQVVSAQEAERHRVSRELHDEAGQALTALKLGLGIMLTHLPPDVQTPVQSAQLRRQLRASVELCETTMAQIRQLAHDLRPAALDDLGLNPALEGFCLDFGERTQLAIEYIGCDIGAVLTDAVKVCFYRCLQEALTNVSRHANAQKVSVTLQCTNKEIRMAVKDDGCGFDLLLVGQNSQPTRLGLLGMRERIESLSGRLEIESKPGQGTCLTVALSHWEPA